MNGSTGSDMEDDAAMLALLEWAQRTLDDLTQPQPTEFRHADGTEITKENP